MSRMSKSEYRESKQAEARKALEDGLTALTSGEGFQRWITVRAATDYRYSFNNQILIAMQCPHATRVAGYRKWQSVGRQVKKGEKAIRIFAPMMVRTDRDDPESEKRVLFRLVNVFDVSQTEGEALGEPPTWEPLTGDSHAGYLIPLLEYAEALGWPVLFEPMDGHGFCHYGRHVIGINSEDAPNQQVKTLIHELAHAQGVGYQEYGRGVAEVVVESVAWIIGRSLRLEQNDLSFGYIAGWSGGSVAEIGKHAQKIDELAQGFEKALGLAKGQERKGTEAA